VSPGSQGQIAADVRRSAISRAISDCSVHSIRHSTAMHMLQAGVDITLIALWLGHENAATTHMYVGVDLAMKEKALNAIQPPRTRQTRYQPKDRVLHFLEML
jgi:integrase/recombinase XerD